MLAVIALAAALTFPPPGKYLYAVTTASGAETAADVWIYATSQGIVTHEEIRSATPIATTDQYFDEYFHPNWYSGADVRGSQLFIHITRWRARVTASGKTTDVEVDRSRCVLVLDNGLTASVMLPSLVRATGSTFCTFIVASGATTVRATIDTTVPRARPKSAAPNDLAMTVKIGSVTEKLWYDPRTLIPDYIDFGNGASARLSATTGEQ
ncbi:MAG: hypothetical protein NVSMB31_01180 [Vulcanimicrobiaceae bacterium]